MIDDNLKINYLSFEIIEPIITIGLLAYNGENIILIIKKKIG